MLGRVSGHRGLSGEITVRVYAGEAAPWSGVSQVRVRLPGDGTGQVYSVEHSRTYRDRLVLKLAGIDDATRAASLRSGRVEVPEAAAPEHPAGGYLVAKLIGCRVIDDGGRTLGRVRDVMPTAGTDLLVVDRGGAEEESDEDLLIPMTDAIIDRVDQDGESISVRLPQGLLDLNRPGEPS